MILSSLIFLTYSRLIN